jgi:hypothetical protein
LQPLENAPMSSIRLIMILVKVLIEPTDQHLCARQRSNIPIAWSSKSQLLRAARLVGLVWVIDGTYLFNLATTGRMCSLECVSDY